MNDGASVTDSNSPSKKIAPAPDLILFTEDSSDFKLVQSIATALNFKCNVFNIPLHGFSEYPKALNYREAYRMLIGGNTPHTVLLDRDYYPQEHLEKVRDDLSNGRISTLFTPGKEIENLFLSPATLSEVIPEEYHDEFDAFWETTLTSEKLDAYGSFLTLHKQFLAPKLDVKSITTKYTPIFDAAWNDESIRYRIIPGKKVLQHVKSFYRDKTGRNLTMPKLIKAAVTANEHEVKAIIGQALGKLRKRKQTLHY